MTLAAIPNVMLLELSNVMADINALPPDAETWIAADAVIFSASRPKLTLLESENVH